MRVSLGLSNWRAEKLHAEAFTPPGFACSAAHPTSRSSSVGKRPASRRARFHRTFASRSAERAKLATLISDLRAQQEGYERASSGWTEDAAEEKKRLRQARQDTLLQINVVLAQLGEVDLIHELEKLPFERRIERLNVYLREGLQGPIPM